VLFRFLEVGLIIFVLVLIVKTWTWAVWVSFTRASTFLLINTWLQETINLFL